MDLKELKNLKGLKRVVLLNSQDEVHLNNQRELFDRRSEGLSRQRHRYRLGA